MKFNIGIYLTTEQIQGNELPCSIKPNETYILNTLSTPNYIDIFDKFYKEKIVLIIIVKNYEIFLYDFRKYDHLDYNLLPITLSNDRERVYKSIDDKEEGVELSFRPDIFQSIHTSLANPQSYLSEISLINKIYKHLLEGGKSLASIQKYFKENISDEINSLLFAEIIDLRKGKYFINQKLLNCHLKSKIKRY